MVYAWIDIYIMMMSENCEIMVKNNDVMMILNSKCLAFSHDFKARYVLSWFMSAPTLSYIYMDIDYASPMRMQFKVAGKTFFLVALVNLAIMIKWSTPKDPNSLPLMHVEMHTT